LAADHQHALVAQFDGAQKLLHHDGLRAVPVERLHDAAQIEAVLLDPEDAHAAHAIERLQDDVLVLGMEQPDVLRRARDQGRGNQFGELKNGQFFRMVAQRARPVEDPRAFALGLFEQVRGVEKLVVKRRILAHHDRVELIQAAPRLRFDFIPRQRFAGEPDGAAVGLHRGATVPGQVLWLARREGVAARLRRTHHGEGGVLVDLE